MRRFQDSGSDAGQTQRGGRSTKRQFCCWTKCIIFPTGQRGSRASGIVPAPAAIASKGDVAEGTCPCCDGEALRRCNTRLLFSSFCFGKGTKDTQQAMKKASGTFTNGKTRSCHLFSVIYAEDKRIGGKTVGKLYKYPDGSNAVCPTKFGNYEQSANGSQRAYKSGVRSCTGT
jgi:hypothetical protein